MEYDWADETIHAHYGKHWLTKLHESWPDVYPALEVVRDHCNELVAATLTTVTGAEREGIESVAHAMLEKAQAGLAQR